MVVAYFALSAEGFLTGEFDTPPVAVVLAVVVEVIFCAPPPTVSKLEERGEEVEEDALPIALGGVVLLGVTLPGETEEEEEGALENFATACFTCEGGVTVTLGVLVDDALVPSFVG